MQLEWDAAIAVGHAALDRDHQELFRRVAALVRALESGSGAEVSILFGGLREFIVEHFGREEAMMDAARFPGQAGHRGQHRRFLRELDELRQLSAVAGPSRALALRTGLALVDRIRAHIDVLDRGLARYVRPTTAVR